MKKTTLRRAVAALLAAAAVFTLLCASGCSDKVFEEYQSNTFELGENW